MGHVTMGGGVVSLLEGPFGTLCCIDVWMRFLLFEILKMVREWV